MSYPRYHPTGVGDGNNDDNDYNAIVDFVKAGVTPGAVIAYPYDYIIRTTAGVCDAISKTGTRDYGGAGDAGGVDGHDPAAVINAAIDTGNGKHIKIMPGTYEFTDTIYVNSGELAAYAENMQNIVLEGSGTNNTILKYTGSDYAVHWRGRFDQVPDSFKICDLTVDCGTVTAGRCGIKLDRGDGQNTVIRDVQLIEPDIGIYVLDTDTNLIDHVYIRVCNTGIKGAQSGLCTQNKLKIHNYMINYATNYGIHLAQGRQFDIGPGCVANSDIGIYVDNNLLALNIHDFQSESNVTADIYIQGASATYPTQNVKISDCSFRSVGAAPTMKAVSLKWVDNVIIDNCNWWDIPTAIYYYAGIQTPTLIVNNPIFDTVTTTIDFDSIVDGLNRFAGTVNIGAATGLITMAAGGNLVAGDLVEFGETYVFKSYGAGTHNPAVVLLGGLQNHPCVVATAGIVPVTVDDATTAGAILVPSDTNGKACDAADSTAVATNKIVGHCVKGTAGAGTAYVRVGV